jgi:hypothetical protein
VPPNDRGNLRKLLRWSFAMWDSMLSGGIYSKMPQRAKKKATDTLAQVLHARHPGYTFALLPGVGPDRPVASPSGRQVAFEITGPNDQAAVIRARATADEHGVYRAAENPAPLID